MTGEDFGDAVVPLIALLGTLILVTRGRSEMIREHWRMGLIWFAIIAGATLLVTWLR